MSKTKAEKERMDVFAGMVFCQGCDFMMDERQYNLLRHKGCCRCGYTGDGLPFVYWPGSTVFMERQVIAKGHDT
jgi:hypothetical protein